MEREIRTGAPFEVRADGNAIFVSGYAAVFGQEAVIGGYFREVIAPGAFTDAIGRDDVVFRVDHSGGPLARTRSGTLTLKEDQRGLYMESELDGSDPDVQAVAAKMRRKDLDKMSFAFFAEIEEWDETGDLPLRTIRQAQLIDVSIVTFPAYDQTEIALRSLDKHRKATNFNAAARRLRLKADLDLRTRVRR